MYMAAQRNRFPHYFRHHQYGGTLSLPRLRPKQSQLLTVRLRACMFISLHHEFPEFQSLEEPLS